MSISNKQKTAMAAIIVAGTVGIAAILLTQGQHSGDDGHGHDSPTAEAKSHSQDDGTEHKEEVGHDDNLVRLNLAQIQAANIQLSQVGPAKIAESATFPGEIRFNDDRTAHIVPRLAGVVEKVAADLGQQVSKGQLLTVIASTALSELRSELLAAERRLALANSTFEREKKLWEEKISAQQDYLQAQTAREEALIAVQNASQKLQAVGANRKTAALNQFELRAPFDGMIVEKHLALGEAVSDTANIFTISDLRSVWAEFIVAPKDLAAVRVGARVTISSSAFAETTEGIVSYVGSLLGEQTRTAKARVTLNNPGMSWRPGLFISVKVWAKENEVPLAVQASALQTLDDDTVVFVQTPEGFKAQAIKAGRSDGVMVEVLDGLDPGATYASAQAFILKAELGKASAEHAH